MKLSEYSDEELIEEVQHRGLIICTNKVHDEIKLAANELLTELGKQHPDIKKAIEDINEQ